MSNLIWVLLPGVLLLVLYVFIFTRRGEIERARVSLRRNDWITFFAVIFGSVALSSAMSASGIRIPNAPWLLMVPILLIAVILIIALVRKARTGRPILQIIGDERMELIYAKSSRNALFATYLALFIHLSLTDADTLDTNWLIILLASGLFVLIASTFIYYYRKS